MLRAAPRLPGVQLLDRVPPRPPGTAPRSHVEGVVIGALALAVLLVGVVGCAVWSGWWARRQVAELEAEWERARDPVVDADRGVSNPPHSSERSFDERG